MKCDYETKLWRLSVYQKRQRTLSLTSCSRQLYLLFAICGPVVVVAESWL